MIKLIAAIYALNSILTCGFGLEKECNKEKEFYEVIQDNLTCSKEIAPDTVEADVANRATTDSKAKRAADAETTVKAEASTDVEAKPAAVAEPDADAEPSAKGDSATKIEA